MASIGTLLRGSIVPSIVAAGLVYVGNAYVVPSLIQNDICIYSSKDNPTPQPAYTTTDFAWMLAVDAIAIFLGVMLGDYINRSFFT